MNSLAVANRWPGSEELDSFVTIVMMKSCTSVANYCISLTKGVYLCTVMVNGHTHWFLTLPHVTSIGVVSIGRHGQDKIRTLMLSGAPTHYVVGNSTDMSQTTTNTCHNKLV